MKKVITLFIILMIHASALLAQDNNSVSIPKNGKGLAEYTDVIPVDSASKNDLYVNALEWMNKTYKSGKSVIQTTDKDGGMIIGKAISQNLTYNNMGVKKDGGYFSYTISIYCKDNKYKYTIDNIVYNKGEMMLSSGADLAEDFPHNWTGVLAKNKQTRREWTSFQNQADTEFKIILASLKIHMSSSKKNSEW